MEYWRIKKKVFKEIVLTSIIGMLIALLCVLYLTQTIKTQKVIIDDLRNREPVLIYIEKKDETQKEIITQSGEVENNSNSWGYVSLDDRELLAKILYCEGRGESKETQKAIISVIFNRLECGYWGSTFKDVIYARGQFEPVSSGAINRAKPTKVQYDVIDDVIFNGNVLPEWVLYFRASYHFDWKGYTQYCNLDNTYFGGFENGN